MEFEKESTVFSNKVNVDSPMVKENQIKDVTVGTPFNDSEKPKSGKKRCLLFLGPLWFISITLMILALSFSHQYEYSLAVDYIWTFSWCLFVLIPLILICIWLYGRIRGFRPKMDLLRENYASLSKKKKIGAVSSSFLYGFVWLMGYFILSVVIIALCVGVTLSFYQEPELTYENYGEELDKVSYFVYMEWKNIAFIVFEIITIIITIIALILPFYFAGKRFLIFLSDKCSRMVNIDTDMD